MPLGPLAQIISPFLRELLSRASSEAIFSKRINFPPHGEPNLESGHEIENVINVAGCFRQLHSLTTLPPATNIDH